MIILIIGALSSLPKVNGENSVIEGPVIGIDLGTTYSGVAFTKNDKTIIIQNEQGNRITPSVVSFTDNGQRLIGDPAKNIINVNKSKKYNL